MKDQLGEDSNRDQLIILVHGIRTRAMWQNPLKAEFEKAGLKVELTNFDYFDLISFLVPLKYFRNKKIARISKQLRQAISLYSDPNVSVLAHSFGSYIIAEILAAEPDLKLHRVVFCGSIVPFDHPFITQLGPRIRTRVVNDVGRRWRTASRQATDTLGHMDFAFLEWKIVGLRVSNTPIF
jgi:pimeloyl-ACP methyl ester carboxylesterase